MTCPEERTVAFLHGELSEADARAFDAHLLECEACWRAVQEDREGRLALERVRPSAPVGLADRIALALELDPPVGLRPGRPDRPRTHRRVGVLVALAASVAVLAGAGISVLLSRSSAGEAPQLSAVVGMLAPKVLDSAPIWRGEHVDIAGQAFTVRAVHFGGHAGIVAVSELPFPMPRKMALVRGSSPGAWMATDGATALYGLNRPAGKASMVVVADVPIAVLPEMAARYHLI